MTLPFLILALGFAAFAATLFGGLMALRIRDHLHLVLGFSAGAIIAVAFFDLLPEALTLAGAAYTSSTIVACVALGFVVYLALDRMAMLFGGHTHGDHEHDSNTRGPLRASSLSLHSFLDGLGIGLAFHVSPSVGAFVAAAVLTHDFSDGINTVSVIVRHGGSQKKALTWLAVDALAPFFGAASTLLFSVPTTALGLLLALFSGFFLYIGATDLIPESHHRHPKLLTTFMTMLGMAVLYAAIRVDG